MHRRIWTGIVLWIVIAASVAFAGNLDARLAAKMNAPLRLALRTSKPDLIQLASKPERVVGVLSEGGSVFLDVFITTSLSRNELSATGVTVRSHIGNVYTARINYDDIYELAQNPKIQKISLSTRMWEMLDVSADETGDMFDRLGCNAKAAWSRVTGSGVIIGIVDTGIDWDHKDFIKDPDTGNQSRILYLWDQTLTAISGESQPSLPGFNYGVEYPQSWINNELSGATSGNVRSKDTNGHGTHIAGITGGDGSDSDGDPPPPKYIGIAPGADFIIVKSDLLGSHIIDGVNYIFQQAAALGRPAVVNLSLGYNFGPHDDTSEVETSLDNLTGAGKLIAVAAGNNNGRDIHSEAVISPGGSKSTTFNVPVSPSITQLWIDIWVDAGDTYNVSVTAPSSATAGPQSPGGSNTWTLSGEGDVTIENYNNSSHPAGDQEIFLDIEGISGGNIASGDWSFTLSRIAGGGDGAFDAWIAVPDPGIVKFTTNNTEEEIISVPGTAKNLITVAAHRSKNHRTASNGNVYGWTDAQKPLGAIASFSSIGPSRDTPSDPGYLKPDISAPGFVIASALSTDYSPSPSEIADDGRHRMNQGTSMSAPHVAGALALFLQKDRTITPARARDALAVSAYEDVDTGSLPNYVWGYGKLNVALALDEFTAARHWELYR